jgi:hypothetical protein
MRLLVRTLAVLCLMAFAAGQELRREAQTVRVPASAVPADVCMANGRVLYATEHPSEPGVYQAHCASGVVLVSGGRQEGRGASGR